MTLRHAVLATLLDGEHSGYQLAKIFDTGVSNFWHALPQQLYAELAKLERAGLITSRQIVQHDRPNKRLHTVTPDGLAELERFAAASSKPLVIRDDLLVKVYAVDHIDPAPVIEQLDEQADRSAAKIAIFDQMLENLNGADRVGPYLTCLAGRRVERVHRDWCVEAAALLRERNPAHPKD